MSRNAVIVSAARTPVGKYQGSLAPLSAQKLGGVVIAEAAKRANLDVNTVDEVFMGNVISAGLGQLPARQAALFGGIPDFVPATHVNKVCGSGLMAVMLAAQAIRAGDANVMIAGGMESMSNGPYLLQKARTGYRMGNGVLVDAVVNDGLWCAIENQHMGMSAEWIAAEYNIKREDMDAFSVKSHLKTVESIKAGKFKKEIVPVEVPQKKGSIIFDTDELPRADSNMESMAKLSPAFKKDGVVTAGNASSLSDGAAALVLMEEEYAKKNGFQPMARVIGYASAAAKPLHVFTVPPLAINKMLKIMGMTLADFDTFELNEAFSCQMLANGKVLGVNWDQVNQFGGSIAIGHPIGGSGARILTTLIYGMKDRGNKRGIASLCLGGGGAVALAVEAI